jgi:3-deoxy-D-manno-octulosonic-acid transferase
MPEPGSKADWRFIAYNVVLVILSPLLLLFLVWRLLIKGKGRAGLWERLGFMPPAAAELGHHNDPVVWFQACSVGETAAVDPIIRILREIEPMAHIVVSNTTQAGHEAALSRRLEVDALVYFPFDIPPCISHALNQVKPDLLVMVETELWPNIAAMARARGIRTAVINGRISNRAYPRDMAIRPLLSWTLNQFDAVLVQSDLNAERFRNLGAPDERVEVLGNSKFDEQMPQVSAAEADMLRMELGLAPDAPVLVAGSTREGEEEKVLDAFDILRHEHRDLQLVIAPRHIERGDAIERLILERGYAVARRSRQVAGQERAGQQAPTSQVRVVLLDTIGELTRVYALSTIVFVGGSLVPWGGHNILQPIALGKPTLMGPWMHNQQDMVDIALAEGAAITVHNPQELADVAARLVYSEAEREMLAARGQSMMSHHGGASRRYAERLSRLLHEE